MMKQFTRLIILVTVVLGQTHIVYAAACAHKVVSSPSSGYSQCTAEGVEITVQCPSGYKMTGGGIAMSGVHCGDHSSYAVDNFESRPAGSNKWRCQAGHNEVKCYVICLKEACFE